MKATKVAPLGQTKSGLTSEQLNALAQQSDQVFMKPDIPQVDPEAIIRQQISTYQPDPGVPPPSKTPLLEQPLVSNPSLDSSQSLVLGYGSQYANRPSESPVLDEKGNTVIDQETGLPLMRPIGTDEFAGQQESEILSQARINQSLSQMDPVSGDIYNQAKGTLANIQGESQDAAVLGDQRRLAKVEATKDDIDRASDRSAMSLAYIVSDANSSLFSSNSSAKVDVETADGFKQAMPAGFAILANEGLVTPEQQAPVGTILGIALAKAAVQTPIDKGEKKDPVVSTQGRVIDDAEYMSNMINAVNHFSRNGLERMGIKLAPQSIQQLSKAIVLDNVKKGNLVLFHDGDRPIVQVSPQYKAASRDIQLASEAIVGDYGRRRSSTVPNRSGTTFSVGKQQLTAKSLNNGNIVTTVAEVVKDILGSVAYTFGEKDRSYKEIELQLLTQPQYMKIDQSSGQFQYSTHWAADRNGLGEKDFIAAKLKVKPPEGYDSNDPDQKQAFEYKREVQAREVMNFKLSQFKNDLANASKSTGNRYAEWMHSLANQRFFPNNFDIDYMGSKAYIRDMLGFGKKEATSGSLLFDDTEIERLKAKASSIFVMEGNKQQAALEALPPPELAAIGTMINAVINYNSAVGGTNSRIVKHDPGYIISQYTSNMGLKLAEVGRQYNEFLADPNNATENIQELLAGMEKGESMGSKNLWDDMYQLLESYKNKDKTYVPLTHHSVNDGNQNGIFLQALFYGNQNNAIRLGTFNPNLDDMREFATSSMIGNLEQYLTDQPEKAAAFANFFSLLKSNYSKESFSKEIFKKPLMQNSYGKDASMFQEMMNEIIMDVYSKEAAEALSAVYKDDMYAAAADLNAALESTLREIVNSNDSNIMKAAGRFTAVMNQTVMMPGLTGDTYVLTASGVLPVNKAVDSGEVVEATLDNGKTILIKRKENEVDVFNTPEGEVAIPTYTMQSNPSAGKGMSMYYDARANKWNAFNSPMGTSQMRLFVVMPIQSMDGDLVKMTTLGVNNNKKSPVPVMWVHDSIISTPGNSIIYRNAYNNIAIPNAMPNIAKFGKKFKDAVNDAHRQAIYDTYRKGVPVGIGSKGDYPAMGAYFDEIFERIQENSSYKEVFLKRKHNNELKWAKYVANKKKFLDEARANGWESQDELGYSANHLAVTPKQFKELATLIRDDLQLGGPEDKFSEWAAKFESRSKTAGRELLNAARKHRINQMSYGPTGERKSISGNLPLAKSNKPLTEQMEGVTPEPIPSKNEELDISEFPVPIPKKKSIKDINQMMAEASKKNLF